MKTYKINLRRFDDSRLGITIDETVDAKDLEEILSIFKDFSGSQKDLKLEEIIKSLHTDGTIPVPTPFKRKSEYLTHPVFNSHHLNVSPGNW